MTTKKTITVYLCPTKPQGAYFVQGENEPQDELSVSGGDPAQIILPLKREPVVGIDDCEGEKRTLQMHLMSEGADLVDCLWPGPAELSWKRDYVNKALDPYLTIEWSNPQDNCAGCFWWSTTVGSQNILKIYPNYPFIVSSGRKWSARQSGLIVDSKDDSWTYPVPPTDVTYETTPNIVPGEELVIHWEMKIDGVVYETLMANVWFKTPLATGGKIISVSNQFEDTQTWEVEVEGVVVSNVTCTDFAQYNIGSYVYFLKQDEEIANLYERDQMYDGDEEDFKVRLIPLDFKGLEGVEGSLDTLNYSLQTNFRQAFELCYFHGIITEMTGETATVEVTIPTPLGTTIETFTEVPIFYHCAADADTTNGYLAFVATDTVIILNENVTGPITNTDLNIVGHTNSLRHCTRELIWVRGGMNRPWNDPEPVSYYITIFDPLDESVVTDVPLNGGGFAVFPCLDTEISDWFEAATNVSNQLYWDPWLFAQGRVVTSYPSCPGDDGDDTVNSGHLDIDGSWPIMNSCTSDYDEYANPDYDGISTLAMDRTYDYQGKDIGYHYEHFVTGLRVATRSKYIETYSFYEEGIHGRGDEVVGSSSQTGSASEHTPLGKVELSFSATFSWDWEANPVHSGYRVSSSNSPESGVDWVGSVTGSELQSVSLWGWYGKHVLFQIATPNIKVTYANMENYPNPPTESYSETDSAIIGAIRYYPDANDIEGFDPRENQLDSVVPAFSSAISAVHEIVKANNTTTSYGTRLFSGIIETIN